MRIHHLLLLAAIALFSSTNATSTTDDKAIQSDILSSSMTKQDAGANRFLRAYDEEDNESRAINLGNLFKSSETKLVEQWTKNHKSVDDVFEHLQLGAGVNQLFANNNLRKWAKFSTVVDKQQAQPKMIAKLTAVYGDQALATALQQATQTGKFKKLAAQLQKAQFEKWHGDKLRPADVVEKVFKYGPGEWLSTPAKPIRRAYQKFLDKHDPKWFDTLI